MTKRKGKSATASRKSQRQATKRRQTQNETSEHTDGEDETVQKSEPNLPRLKPAWARYYERQALDRNSNHSKGVGHTYNYYDHHITRQIIGDNNGFFNVISHHVEICAMIYHYRGSIQILHHLTPAIYGSPIIVGVNGAF